METGTLDFLQELVTALDQGDGWKADLTGLFTTLRRELVFDNLALYLLDEHTGTLEVAYARSTGRGKGAEADAAWGESLAFQVLASGETTLIAPATENAPTERIRQAHMLGLPLRIAGKTGGALALVRFGGPEFSPEHRRLASVLARLVALVIERRTFLERLSGFEVVQRQLQLQEDFVATISHELRTPLGFIKGYTTTLLRSDTEWDGETRREFLAIIDEEADRLSELIENVLEAARLQSHTLPMNFQMLRLESLLRDALLRARARYPDLRLEMECGTLPAIRGDSVRLAQVLENLISNAAKYAPSSTVTIRAAATDSCLRLSVADGGPGIPPEHLALIFDRFYRVPGQPSRSGSGLGLFICRQIIEAHQGKIWAESTVGRGTTFFVDLPLMHPS